MLCHLGTPCGPIRPWCLPSSGRGHYKRFFYWRSEGTQRARPNARTRRGDLATSEPCWNAEFWRIRLLTPSFSRNEGMLVDYSVHIPRTRCYRDGVVIDENFPLADVSEHLELLDTVVWVDLCTPDGDDLALLADELGLHELAVEDAIKLR